ncbi:cob(I)yrinic acid a,c-diamide adenosyltransferase [Falsirhodobacter sp. alg1]|uniref:cob(I)yrinic acid a,c-diamide adenosyltransferase n=1 Tax=Falsirhodobacter sp. alg1 TaxID=1472418 RepID=UPI0005EEB056|nr:cob(I)yrinic acid a,c-diamide adenosyltransferase [Falsirhodobacter sp. alg1]
MVTLSKIYTRTGDDGTTALGDGQRVAKTDPRVEAYGTVDELNATVGIARLYASALMDKALARISNELFDLGADLCRPDPDRDADSPYPVLRMIPAQVDRLEQEMDRMNATLDPLRSFVLPGGSQVAAHLHLCRTVCRRAERMALAVPDTNPVAIRYLNRLSDWFFVASRAANAEADGDVLWQPGKTRDA